MTLQQARLEDNYCRTRECVQVEHTTVAICIYVYCRWSTQRWPTV